MNQNTSDISLTERIVLLRNPDCQRFWLALQMSLEDAIEESLKYLDADLRPETPERYRARFVRHLYKDLAKGDFFKRAISLMEGQIAKLKREAEERIEKNRPEK